MKYAAGPTLRSLFATGIAALAVPAYVNAATFEFTPQLTAGIESNSNLYDRSKSEPPPFALSGNTHLDDTVTKYLAGLTTSISNTSMRLALTGDVTRMNYDRFSNLNHSEYHGLVTFDWRMGPIVDVSLRASRQRSLAGMGDILTDELSRQTIDLAQGTVRVRVMPKWRVDFIPLWNKLDLPLPGNADFGVNEDGGTAVLNYLGTSKLTAGLSAGYLNGKFHGVVGATQYRQKTVEAVADYVATGFSAFTFRAGFTSRDSKLRDPSVDPVLANATVGKTSGFTGALNYRRTLSVKTSVNAGVFRTVQNYAAGANSSIGTGFEAGAAWDPTRRIGLTLNYRYTDTLIDGYLVTAARVPREDRMHSASFSIRYAATRRFALRPYIMRELRASNLDTARYRGTTTGVDLTATFD